MKKLLIHVWSMCFKFEQHCIKSRRYNDEKEIINYDIVSVFDDILKLINKNNIEIKNKSL